MPRRKNQRDEEERLPKRRISKSKGSKGSRKAVLTENRPVSPAVLAKTRPAKTPAQGSDRRTRSQMRTPDSPQGEQVTRSPGSGNLTTTPTFSPPSSPDDKDSESESSSSSSDTETGSDESIPEGLRPEWVPPVQKDSDETDSDSDSESSKSYSLPEEESSVDEEKEDFPLNYSPISNDEEEEETKGETFPLQESKEDSAPHQPPRHSRESHYDRFMNGEAGSSDSDVEDMTLDSSVLERRRYIAEELEENLRATLTVNSQQVEFWKHVPVLNNPVEMNGSADRPPLIVIDLESSRYPHRFRWDQDSENTAVDTIVDCFKGFIRQAHYYTLNGEIVDRTRAESALRDFGELIFANLGANRLWTQIWKRLYQSSCRIPPGLQRGLENPRITVLDAIEHRESNPGEERGYASIHCFGQGLIMTNPRPPNRPPAQGWGGSRDWQRGTVWEDTRRKPQSQRSNLWNPDRDHFTGTPNRGQYRPNERRDSGMHVTRDHPAEWQSHREYDPRAHREPRRSSRSPDGYAHSNSERQNSRPSQRRSNSPTRESRDSREQQAPASQELPDWGGNPTPATGTVLKALRPPSYTEFFTTKNKAWGEIITFLREAQSRQEDPQMRNWSKRTIRSISSLWDDHAPSDRRGQSSFNRDSWQHLPLPSLIDWMEKMKKTGIVGYNRADQYRQLIQLIAENPLSIDCADHSATSKDNTIRDATLLLEEAFEQFKGESNPEITPEEERALCKFAWDLIELNGINAASAEEVKSSIKRKCNSTSNPNDPSDFLAMIRATAQAVAQLLLQRQTYEQLYEVDRRPNNGQHSKKSNPSKSKDKTNSNKSKSKKRKGESPTRESSGAKSSKKTQAKCYGCGYFLNKEKGTGRLICPRKTPGSNEIGCYKDERRNTEKGVEWSNSTVGKQWARLGFYSIPKDPSTTLANAVARSGDSAGTYLHSLSTNASLDTNLIPFTLEQEHLPKSQSAKRKRRDSTDETAGKLLLDTGAIGSSVMSSKYAKRIRKCAGSYNKYSAKHSIQTAGNNKLKSDKLINLKLNVASEQPATTPTQIDVTAAIAPIEVDMILDRDTIKENDLVQKFPSHFAEGELLERIRSLPQVGPPVRTAREAVLAQRAHHNSYVHAFCVNPTMDNWIESTRTSYTKRARSLYRSSLVAEAIRDEGFMDDPMATMHMLYSITAEPVAKRLTKKQKRAKARRRKQEAKAPLFTERQIDELHSLFLAAMHRMSDGNSNYAQTSAYERDGKLALDEIPEHKLESIPADLLKAVLEDNEYAKVNIGGPPELRDKLRKLIREFKEIFRATVQKRSSSAFTPFVLDVDDELWERPCNAVPPRTLGREREEELDRMITVLMANDIIEDCTHTHCSAAFLVPKPNGKWRFVLDFKNLNAATRNKYEWPIPNIKDMLNRVGESRPEYFATFDLTSGYYQAPIAEESRKYTAFKTKKGVYRWKRLAMGLREAGSYFQHQLSTKVLNGLIHHTCELYLDDCMVYAGDVDEYIDRLRGVFTRFREHGITLNPAKCHLGLTQVEYVGHTINKNGLHFTRDKLDSVMNFPRPSTMKNVKSFVGLANYFRDHIKNHSTRVQPLQDLVEGYTKQKARHKVEWTDECQKAFEDIRQAIDECPLLWFIDDHSPIFLQTDASDYGIGAYLYQKVMQEDGTEAEHPVGFISKSLVSGHDSWDVPMKEGFAIFYALRKWEYLLRDRRFTILTDHANLTRMREERNTNKMVKRWFQAYQEYDIIDWIHVPGMENHVPDSFSRLCANECSGDQDKTSTSLLFQLTGYEMDPKHWEIIRTKGHGTASDKGHGGVTRTLDVLDRQGLNWPTRTKDVRKFIKMCPCCQKMSVWKPVIHSHPYTLSTYGLFHTVSVDLIERLATDDFGMSMIVVIIDNFSRFVDLYPIADTSAESTADALIKFTGRFGTPVRFTTDSGSNFKSKIISGLAKKLGADHHLTKAYSKQQNGMVERVNREILEHLRGLIFDKRVQTKWSRYLPIVQRYINTSRHSATGCTPAELVFPSGAEIDKKLLTDPGGGSLSEYVSELQDAQNRIIALAEQRLRKRDQAHIDRKSDGVEPEYTEGSYVLVEHRHNSLRPGPKSKMLPYKAGPMLVIRKLEKGMYTLRDLITMEPKDFHVSKMTPFLYDERTLEPAHVAAKDTFDEFVIEKVLDLVGDPTKSRKELKFLVRWAGYGEEDDTLVDWKDCRTATAVQNFLYNHPNKRVRNLCMKDFDPNKVVEEEPFNRHSDDEASID